MGIPLKNALVQAASGQKEYYLDNDKATTDIRNAFRQFIANMFRLYGFSDAQAESIIADAQQQAMILAGDQEVVRLAQQQADAIRDQAEQYERDTRYNAEEYADTVLAHLEENLKSLTNSQ